LTRTQELQEKEIPWLIGLKEPGWLPHQCRDKKKCRVADAPALLFEPNVQIEIVEKTPQQHQM